MPQSKCRYQADWCGRLGSPLYAYLLTQCAIDYEHSGPLRRLLQPHEHEPGMGLPLQMMGAVHRLVLEGRAPELARYYPSAGGSAELEPAWRAFRDTVARNLQTLTPLILGPVQTNDAGRSGSLLPGFLLIAAHTGLPLRLLEIGSSAGLNLCWDRYRYEWPGGAWGDPASPLRIENIFVGEAPVLPSLATVASRAGCDPNPIDPRTPEGRLTLRSYTWADQPDRLRRLDAAISIASAMPYRIDKAGAAEWLPLQLADIVPGTATVVFHSVVWPYLAESERHAVTALIENAGQRATAAAPLAWLRMEPGAEEAEVRLRIYPGLEECMIARCGFHSPAVRWAAPDSSMYPPA